MVPARRGGCSCPLDADRVEHGSEFSGRLTACCPDSDPRFEDDDRAVEVEDPHGLAFTRLVVRPARSRRELVLPAPGSGPKSRVPQSVKSAGTVRWNALPA